MTLILYGLKNCDSCKKAIKAIEATGKAITFFDVRNDGISKESLDEWLAAVGRDKLVNTRSTTWRALSDDERVMENDEDAKRLLILYPTLIKRPVIINQGTISVGWSKGQESLFAD
ncbi:MAG: Spx/MgsR family RNA polymerase-binding regulatory protein [Hyphomicrobiales bacterium]